MTTLAVALDDVPPGSTGPTTVAARGFMSAYSLRFFLGARWVPLTRDVLCRGTLASNDSLSWPRARLERDVAKIVPVGGSDDAGVGEGGRTSPP